MTGSLVLGLGLLWGNPALAQIAADQSAGTVVNANTVINGRAGTRIDGGTIRGGNLLHSFDQFNLGRSERAYFSNPADITNIVSRVTGSSASSIQGTLGVLGNANLFLINPNGIVFGAGASLDVKGSFVATTANAIQLNNGDILGTNLTTPLPNNVLNVNPSAFLFNQVPARPIQVLGGGTQLAVPTGRSLVFVGGDLDIRRATLVAPEGRVELGTVAGEGAVNLDASDQNNLRLSFSDDLARGNILLSQDNSSSRTAVDVTGTVGGSITIYTRNLDISLGTRLLAGISRGQDSRGRPSGDIVIDATGAVTLVGILDRNDDLGINNNVFANARGNAGNVYIQANSLSLTNNAQLTANTQGIGNAGNLFIQVDGALTLANRTSRISSRVQRDGGNGKGGNIQIQAGSISVTGGAQINTELEARSTGSAGRIEIDTGVLSISDVGRLTSRTRSRGDAGEIVVRVNGPINLVRGGRIISDISRGATGNGGNIVIEAQSLSLSEGGFIEASTASAGRAGDIKIRARDFVNLDGVLNSENILDLETSRIFAGTQTSDETVTSDSRGADIRITTGRLRLANGAVVNAQSRSRFSGGSIAVNANNLEITNGGQILTTAFSSGAAGNISVEVAGQATLSGSDSTYFNRLARAIGEEGSGRPNRRLIRDLIFSDGSTSGLLARAQGTGAGGDLTIHAGQLVVRDGAILTTQSQGSGEAGDIRVDADTLAVVRGGQLLATALSGGSAGNVTLNIAQAIALAGRDPTYRTRRGNAQSLVNQRLLPSIDQAFFNQGDASGVLAQALGAGQGGNITLQTPSLSLRDRAQLSAATSGPGKAGNISVRGANSVVLNNGSISTAVRAGAAGQGGNINLQTRSLSLTGNAQLSAETSGSGRAGSISVRGARLIALSQGSLITTAVKARAGAPSSQLNEGTQGGAINLRTGSLRLDSSAEISARSERPGSNAGNITINASGALQSNNSSISTAANQATGGSIAINARTIRLEGNSDITTRVARGIGNGGNIFLRADTIFAFADSDIIASAAQGKGGDITLDTPVFFGFRYQPRTINSSGASLDGNGRVDINASGQLSNGSVQVPDVTLLQNSLTLLPANLLDTSALISSSCIARRQQEGGSFLVTGAGGLPAGPKNPNASPFPTGTVRSIPEAVVEEDVAGLNQSWQSGDPLEEPDGAYRLADGRIMLSRACSE
ncbi:filamentous hemagglutinin N-terminal domain-containing protein [Leptolyngbya sp. FACHB-261]|uniref:two-partner secretion domain-containing protein n=1 Tax=Leptolyngbya sp. FACHB-261 TaxID=2692806 RepID=UPI001686F71D|nr:filamentous hemagglutinin N-terminal domain-containing protein [Leptolyngbya sp. FACHB-261]